MCVLDRVRTCFPELFGWIQWYYVFSAELWFGKRHIPSYASVQQGDTLNPHLFSLVQVDFFDQIPSIPGVLFSVWYLDNDTIVDLVCCTAVFASSRIFGILFWPTSQQKVWTLIAGIRWPTVHGLSFWHLQFFNALDLLGSPVWHNDDFSFCYQSWWDITSELSNLEDPQCELFLQCNCLNLCKISHLLHTVSLIKPWARYKYLMIAYLKPSRKYYVALCLKNPGSLHWWFGGLGLGSFVCTAPVPFW